MLWSINKIGCWAFNACHVTLEMVCEKFCICAMLAMMINMTGGLLILGTEIPMTTFNVMLIGIFGLLFVGLILIVTAMYWACFTIMYKKFYIKNLQCKGWIYNLSEITIFKCKRKDFKDDEINE